MIRDLNTQAVVTRQVVGKRPYAHTEPNKIFTCQLEPPRAASPGTDVSPREGSPWTMRFRYGPLGLPLLLLAGSRVTIRIRETALVPSVTRVFEVLADAREIRIGGATPGQEVHILPVDVLYPIDARVQRQNGSKITQANVALWTSVESHNDTGTYEDFEGEAPIDLAEDFKARDNAQLKVGDDIYRIVSATVDAQGPRVRFVVRRAGG